MSFENRRGFKEGKCVFSILNYIWTNPLHPMYGGMTLVQFQ
jgi:hypothetical protein